MPEVYAPSADQPKVSNMYLFILFFVDKMLVVLNIVSLTESSWYLRQELKIVFWRIWRLVFDNMMCGRKHARSKRKEKCQGRAGAQVRDTVQVLWYNVSFSKSKIFSNMKKRTAH